MSIQHDCGRHGHGGGTKLGWRSVFLVPAMIVTVLVAGAVLPACQPSTTSMAANQSDSLLPAGVKLPEPKQLEQFVDAIERGQVDTVKAMLATNPELAWGRVTVPWLGIRKVTPLHVAAGAYARKTTGPLGADRWEDMTPEFQTQLVEIAKALLDAGADIDACTDFYITPLGDAVEHQATAGWTGVAELLLQRGANPDGGYRCEASTSTPLHRAVWLSDGDSQIPARLRLIELLLKHGANPCVASACYPDPAAISPYELAVRQKADALAAALREPTEARATAEAAAIRAVVVDWAKAVVGKDEQALAAVTNDANSHPFPPDWIGRAEKLRETYADNPAALATIVSQDYREPWAFVQIAGSDEGTSLLLAMMRFPDGRWRIFHSEEVASDATDLAVTYGKDNLYGSRRRTHFDAYRNGVFDRAGVLPMFDAALKRQYTGTRVLSGLGRMDVLVRDGRLVLIERKPCGDVELELDKAWIKYRSGYARSGPGLYDLEIFHKIERQWRPQIGTAVTLTAADGEATLTQGGRIMTLQRDGDHVRVAVNGETTYLNHYSHIAIDGTDLTVSHIVHPDGTEETTAEISIEVSTATWFKEHPNR